jgi:hypothetical protein
MKSYYISAAGDDANSGESPEMPFKTLSRVNACALQPGDSVLFRKGDVFVGELQLCHSGQMNAPIKVGSYGEGNKPVITGAIPVKEWKAASQDMHVALMSEEVFQLFVSDEWYNVARIPAQGFYTIQDGDKKSLKDDMHLNGYDNLKGATARIRSVNWQYETAKVASHEKDTLFFEELMMYQCSARYGYMLDNKQEFLKAPGQWYWSRGKSELYCIVKPGHSAQNFQAGAVIYRTGISIAEGVSHVSIEGLQVCRFHYAAVWGGKRSSHIRIADCEICEVNVYGIGLDLESEYYEIANNSIHTIWGRGISTLESSHNKIVGNTIREIGLNPGYGFDGVNNGIGIAVLKTEVTYVLNRETHDNLKAKGFPDAVLERVFPLIGLPFPDEKFLIEQLEFALGHELSEMYLSGLMTSVKEDLLTRTFECTNNYVAYNSVDQTGYAGIRVDGNGSLVEYNVITNTLLHMNDGGALYCWAQNDAYTFNNIFQHNIIIGALGNCEATPNNLPYAYGIYTDNKCHHMTIKGNTVIGAVGGILINDEAHDQYIIGNTLYDNDYGLVFSEYFMPGSLRDCVATDNICFCKRRNQRALFVESRIRDSFSPGVLNSNLYANPYYPYPILELTQKDDIREFREFKLTSWQMHSGQDATSAMIATEHHDAGGRHSEIIVNTADGEMAFDLPKDQLYTDIYGNDLGVSANIPAYGSLIILQK